MLIPAAVTIQIKLFPFFIFFFFYIIPSSWNIVILPNLVYSHKEKKLWGWGGSEFIDILCRLRDSSMCENYKYVNIVPACPRTRSSPSILINPPKTHHDRKI